MTGCPIRKTLHAVASFTYETNNLSDVRNVTRGRLRVPNLTARVLRRMSEEVVLLVHAGHTLREAALVVSERLLQKRIPVLGVILNDWNPKSSPDRSDGNYKEAAVKRYGKPPASSNALL